MRMKFNKSSQLLLATAVSLLTAGLITACGTNTVDFVFVTSSIAAGANNYGQIDVFEINRVSGFMRQILASPFPSGGRNPVAEVVSSDETNLYVVNHDDNSIVQFAIGSDGKLYPQNTVNTPGLYPVAVAVTAANLFVVDTFQPLLNCSPANPCSGSVGVFPIEPASGSGVNEVPAGVLGPAIANGTINYWPLNSPISSTHIITPTAINVLNNGSYVYVTAYDSTVTPSIGYIYGFSAGSSGVLAPLNGGVPVVAGIHPSAIASDSTSGHVYVTDSTNSTVVSYSVASGVLTKISSTSTGNQPSAIVVDPTYPYAYVANAVDGNVSAYSIGANGALTANGTYTAGIDPVAIGIDPGTNHFVYTANFLGTGSTGSSGTISGFELSTTTGTLINSQLSPYNSNALPTAVAAVPHGGAAQ
jgi:DNA-binding beta-propeller fold protein YncE